MSLFTDECLELLEQIDVGATLADRREVVEFLQEQVRGSPLRGPLWQARGEDPDSMKGHAWASACPRRWKPAEAVVQIVDD